MTPACPACGAEQPAAARFCSACGASLVRACPSCGAEQPAGAAFCPACGAALGDAAGDRARCPRGAEGAPVRACLALVLAGALDEAGERTHATEERAAAERLLATLGCVNPY